METASLIKSPIFEQFVSDVIQIAHEEVDRARAIQRIEPLFARLLTDKTFVPEEYKQVVPGKMMAQYALYRAEDRSLSIMAMVVPPGSTTPVHDHLAWGLVGVYQGIQKETVYRRLDDRSIPDYAELEEVSTRILNPGDITTLLPPEGDIHRIETVSADASISIHVLGNDIGCEIRHAYDPEHKAARAFRSGYENVPCLEARFDHQHLVVENVDETVEFYTNILGAQQTALLKSNGATVVHLDLNGIPLVISSQTGSAVGNHWGIAVDNLEVAVSQLKFRGVQFLVELGEEGGLKYAVIRDTAGNPIEILERKS